MENKNVMLKNLIDSQVGIILPELHYRRTFEKKGAIKPIPYTTLKEAIWDDGFVYLLKHGIIEILDEEVCKELGIAKTSTVEDFNNESENYDNNQVVLVLDDAKKKRYLTVAPIHELKELLSKMTYEQKEDFINFAIENKYIDYDRVELIEKCTGIDILKRIEFNRSMEE